MFLYFNFLLALNWFAPKYWVKGTENVSSFLLKYIFFKIYSIQNIRTKYFVIKLFKFILLNKHLKILEMLNNKKWSYRNSFSSYSGDKLFQSFRKTNCHYVPNIEYIDVLYPSDSIFRKGPKYGKIYIPDEYHEQIII